MHTAQLTKTNLMTSMSLHTLSPPPRFSEAFILVLKDRGDHHYGREKQQHTYHEPLLSFASHTEQSAPCGGGVLLDE